MGFDDLLAILMVQQSGRSVAGCSLVFGCAELTHVCRHAAAMAATFDWRFPLHPGAASPIVGETETAARILGPTGLPTLGRHLPEIDTSTDMTSAFVALAHWLERSQEMVEVLALGPLTNLAVLKLARPDLYGKIGRVTWMGGAASRGNHTPAAEFNAFADPEAAAIVSSGGAPFRMVDLDVCRQVTVTPSDLQALQTGSEKAALLHDLFGGYIDIGISRGRPSMALYDPVAAAAVISESAVAFEPVRIDVERTDQQARGRTIVDNRPGMTANGEIGMTADAEQIRTLALDALKWAATA